MPIALPPLPYAYDALEPVISAATLKVHHGAHHRGYVDKLNRLVADSELDRMPLAALVRESARRIGDGPVSSALFNNAAQAWNHAFYWSSLRPKGAGNGPRGALAAALDASFGGLRQFAEQFHAAALNVFGSGWVWLVVQDDSLCIVPTLNADTPIARDQTPLLVLDVWEHAYYLDHQSRRAEYLSGAIEHLLNWDFAQQNFKERAVVEAQ